MNIHELNEERTKLTDRKAGMVEMLRTVKDQLLMTLPIEQYQEIENRRRKLIREMQQLDAQLTALKGKRHAAAQVENAVKKETAVNWIKQLVEMRDEYQEFAADHTRSPTMRRMASEFVVKLTPVIRQIMTKE